MTALSAETRALLDRALALPPPSPSVETAPLGQYPGLRVEMTSAVDDTQAKLIAEVLAAVEWPPAIPLPEQLTPAQRDVALALAEHVVDVGEAAIPAARWVRRRWLGLDAPSPLETIHEVGGVRVPLWRVLAVKEAIEHAADADDDYDGEEDEADAQEAALDAVIASLTPAALVEMSGDVLLGAYGLEYTPPAMLVTVGASCATWARAFADRLVALFDDPTAWVERKRQTSPDETLCLLVTLALARSGIELEPRWERFVRVGARGAMLGWSREIISAVAPARRAEVLVRAARPLFANMRAAVLLGLLPDVRSLVVVDAVFETFADPELTRPRNELYAQLRTAVAGDSALAGVVDERLAQLPTPRVLRCRPSVTPATEAELTPLQRAQCAVGAKNIMGCGTDWVNEEEIQFLELFGIEDEAGEHCYDAAILMGEDGVFFAAGTTTPIAWLCQYRLDCEDGGLRDGLQAALAARKRASD